MFVRSPHAHANIRGIDTSRAHSLPGVLAVLTGHDDLGDGCRAIPQTPNPTDVIDHTRPAFFARANFTLLAAPHLPLAVERVRYVGEPVAVIIAEAAHAARDAAEAVVLAYEVLPAVVDALAAIAPGVSAVWPSAPDNVALDCRFGDAEATARAFASAELVVEQSFRNQRIATAQMEPRAAIGDAGDAVSGPAGDSRGEGKGVSAGSGATRRGPPCCDAVPDPRAVSSPVGSARVRQLGWLPRCPGGQHVRRMRPVHAEWRDRIRHHLAAWKTQWCHSGTSRSGRPRMTGNSSWPAASAAWCGRARPPEAVPTGTLPPLVRCCRLLRDAGPPCVRNIRAACGPSSPRRVAAS